MKILSLLAFSAMMMAAIPALAGRDGGLLVEHVKATASTYQAARDQAVAVAVHQFLTRDGRGHSIYPPEVADAAVKKVEITHHLGDFGRHNLTARVTIDPAALSSVQTLPPLDLLPARPESAVHIREATVSHSVAAYAIPTERPDVVIVPVWFDGTGIFTVWPNSSWTTHWEKALQNTPGISLATQDKQAEEDLSSAGRLDDPRPLMGVVQRAGARAGVYAIVTSLLWPVATGDDVQLTLLAVGPHGVRTDQMSFTVGPDAGRVENDLIRITQDRLPALLSP